MAQVNCPILSRQHREQPNLRFDFKPWSDYRFLDLDVSQVDLVLDAKFGSLSPKHRCEVLFKDEFVCAVSKESRYKKRLTLTEYMDAGHIIVNVFENQQVILETALERLGLTRRVIFYLPYFTVALQMVAGTPLIATVPKRLAMSSNGRDGTKLINPPKEFRGFNYVMVWHSRLDGDVQSQWLRNTLRDASQTLLSFAKVT